MTLKTILKPYLFDSLYSHWGTGFLIAGIISIMLPHPWPIGIVFAFAGIREGVQQLGWPWKHEPQTGRTIFANIMEFVAGAAMAALLSDTLRRLI